MGAAAYLLAAEHELLHMVRGLFHCLEISEGRDPKTWDAMRIPVSVSGQWPLEHSIGWLSHVECPTGPGHPGDLFLAPEAGNKSWSEQASRLGTPGAMDVL